MSWRRPFCWPLASLDLCLLHLAAGVAPSVTPVAAGHAVSFSGPGFLVSTSGQLHLLYLPFFSSSFRFSLSVATLQGGYTCTTLLA